MNTKAGFPANMRQYLKSKSKLKNKNKRASMLHILIGLCFQCCVKPKCRWSPDPAGLTGSKPFSSFRVELKKKKKQRVTFEMFLNVETF